MSEQVTSKTRVPTYEKVEEEWVIQVDRAAPIRVKEPAMAQRIWQLAMWSYHNGRDDTQHEIRKALGI